LSLPPATGWCCAVMVITAAMATWSRDWPKRSALRSRCWPRRAINRCRKRPRWHARHG
ncbi:carbohydrate kinase superfamily domain protein, partial [Escherichia coli TT12B]